MMHDSDTGKFGITKTELLTRLPSSDEIRYLTKLPNTIHSDIPADCVLEGTIVDVETTGLDTARDEIISFGFTKFVFNEECTKIFVIEADTYYNEPSEPISEFITDLTGITDETVKGHVLTEEQMNHAMLNSEIIIAHHAAFDRKFLDRYWPVIKPWACTVRDLDLRTKYGAANSSLASVMAQVFGYYMTHHDALEDCFGCFIIAEDNLQELVEVVFRPVYRVVAMNSEFMKKDLLKMNDFKWSNEERAWFKDNVTEEMLEETELLIERCEGDVHKSLMDPNYRWSEVDT